MRTIYLAGPMENVSIAEADGWRQIVKNAFPFEYEVKLLDPTRRIHTDTRDYKRIFELDMLDVRECDFVLVNLCDPKLAKHGTAMEVFYANYILRKPVIAFKDNPDVKHPFFEQLVTTWVSNVNEAIEVIREEYL